MSSQPGPIVVSTKRAWRDLLIRHGDVFACMFLDDVQISRLRTAGSARNDRKQRGMTGGHAALQWQAAGRDDGQISRLRPSGSARNDKENAALEMTRKRAALEMTGGMAALEMTKACLSGL